MLDVFERRLDALRSDDVTVLFACVIGSRAAGYPGVLQGASDWDGRFIFTHPRAAYLKLDPPADHLLIQEPPQGTGPLGNYEALDLMGWDIFKAVKLARSMNPTLLEWLHSPLMVRDAGGFATRLRETMMRSYTPTAAMAFYRERTKKYAGSSTLADPSLHEPKLYLKTLNAIFCFQWCVQHLPGYPPLDFATKLAVVAMPDDVRLCACHMGELFSGASNSEVGPSVALLDRYIAEQLACSFPLNRLSDHLDIDSYTRELNALLAAYV